jgi:phosphoglycolate phosphatase-like HAD superfamily hydrolase
VKAVALDLDGALADTRPLWNAWLEAAAGVLGVRADELPPDRGSAADELDRLGAGNWRTLLARFAEDRAPVFLRRDAAVSAALRVLASSGRRLGVYTDAPEPLARIALAQLGIAKRVSALETGSGALEHLLERVGDDADVIRTRTGLASYASTPAS